jgi:hypothetical protein
MDLVGVKMVVDHQNNISVLPGAEAKGEKIFLPSDPGDK